MTGRERFIAAFRHEAVDRVPTFEQSVASTVASDLLGRPALTGTTDLHHDQAVASLQGEAAYEDFIERTLADNLALAEHLGFEAVSVPWLLARPTKQLSQTEFLYGDPESGPWQVRRFDPEVRSFGVARSGGEPQTEQDIERLLDRRERDLDDYRPTPETAFPLQARLMELSGGRREVVGVAFIQIPIEPLWLMMTVLRSDLVARHLDLAAEITLRNLECQAAMGLRVIWAGGDLANDAGPLYGPKVFRELVLPRVQRITARSRELGLYYLFRTDGNLWSIAADFFGQSGIHGYGEIDSDAGMDPVEVRRRYPGVTLWGGVACGSLLHRGTSEAVRAEVRRVVDGCEGRGIIIGSSNSILHGTPPENVVAMIDEARR